MGILNPFRQWILVVMVAGCLLSATTWAAEKRQRPEQEGPAPVPMEKVTIQKKTLISVITTAGERYAISTGTIIVGTDGQQVSIRDLLVPCDTEITYSVNGKGRQAERIQVKRVASNAKKQWVSKSLE